METFDNSRIELRNVRFLSGLRFIVPDYQRGYRWTAIEAEQMLNDFRDFYKREDKQRGEFYCLQPIVVQKRKDGSYELIDGQQRLTTLYIILKSQASALKILYPNFNLYTIEYETRRGSMGFLNHIGNNADEAEKYIDFHYMQEVYNAIIDWLGGDDVDITDLLGTLLRQNLRTAGNVVTDDANNVRFIWYEVDRDFSLPDGETTQSPVEIFTRLNIGKIPLSNSELIRALLLRRDNFPTHESGLRQIQIASQWNLVEQRLQDDNFWYFINGKGNPPHYDNRIELIFDLMTKHDKDSEFYYSFNKFSEDFKSKNASLGDRQNAAVAIWNDVMGYFLTLVEWYNNRILYHYIGFLVDNAPNGNDELRELLDISKTCEKNVFVSKIKERIKGVMKDCQLSEISYGQNNAQARKVLLLFNIITLLKVDKSDARFPFGKYKTGKWDIEHVCSQTDKTLYADSQRHAWLEDMLDYFSKHDKKDEAAFLERLKSINETDKIDVEEFDELFGQISRKFNEQQIQDRDSLGNLTLLDAQTNRSYGNAFFPIKRQYIIQNDESGIFVPIATKNLFLKYYSIKSKDIMTWSQEDADDYLNAIESTLKDYLPKQKN